MNAHLIYRIADPAALAAASAAGSYEGEAHDRADGFIHCSSLAQIAGTLEAHYAENRRLAVAVIDTNELGNTLKWEASRGGELFPHIYGPLPFSAVRAVHLITRSENGWRLPQELCP
ncbi:MAG: DUF952 domain-containing protein [Oceanicaulis sp.]|nr:DUF952 domain-containing protein [Oceanicaulis sp.]